jgi:hypothetical protein
MLAEVYRCVYKVRNRLLACKNMTVVQTRSSSRERRVSDPALLSVTGPLVHETSFQSHVRVCCLIPTSTLKPLYILETLTATASLTSNPHGPHFNLKRYFWIYLFYIPRGR